MAEANDMERKQKFEQNVKEYLEAMDKIQHDLVKMLEESMKLNEILQDAVSQRAERYLEQDNQKIPREIKSPGAAGDLDKGKDQWGIRNLDCNWYLFGFLGK